MHFVTTDGRIVPCKYDQGTECYVVMKREFDPESDELDVLFVDDEEVEVASYEIVDDTRRTFFISVCDEPSDDDESESEGESSDGYDEIRRNNGFSDDFGDFWDPEEYTGSLYGTVNYED